MSYPYLGHFNILDRVYLNNVTRTSGYICDGYGLNIYHNRFTDYNQVELRIR